MKESNKAIFENAIDFLEKSLEEFKESPKYSVLHFAIAVEILLKARLAIEHWSLVVQKNANKASYLKGDFLSVNLDEAVKRLRDIVGENISDTEFKSFKRLAAHRNKVIHFYHGEFSSDGNSEDLQKIIIEQCECWFHLKSLFTKKWRTHFEDHIERFESLDWKMRRHWEYLSTVFDRRKPELEKAKKTGKTIGTCSYCSFDAVPFNSEYPELSSGNCLVCNWRNISLELECECGHKIVFQNDGFETCSECGKKYEPEDVYSLIDSEGYDTSEWPDNITPANCSFCDSYHTVAAFHEDYLCTSCLEVFDTLEQCGYCGEHCSGDMSDSSWNGCAVCEGSLGNDNS
jgi:hypothetical protein